MDTAGPDPDPPHRPVILDTGRTATSHRRPRPRTVLGVTAAAVLTCAGLVAGSWAVWSVVRTTTPAEPPAPLWFSPPAPIISTGSPGAGSSSAPGIPTDPLPAPDPPSDPTAHRRPPPAPEPTEDLDDQGEHGSGPGHPNSGHGNRGKG